MPRRSTPSLGAASLSECFEGDIIRPLGLVTLYFGYAEYEVDLFLERLSVAGTLGMGWHQRTLGQKLDLLDGAITKLKGSEEVGFDALRHEARSLFDQRNKLVHSCIVAGGQVLSGRRDVVELRTSPEELASLADRIFTWKEHLHVYRWKLIEPFLAKLATVGST